MDLKRMEIKILSFTIHCKLYFNPLMIGIESAVAESFIIVCQFFLIEKLSSNLS